MDPRVDRVSDPKKLDGSESRSTAERQDAIQASPLNGGAGVGAPYTNPVVSAGSASPADVLQVERFINRELSWLEFNRRVLNEALDARRPLLERVRFLSIFNSNLDEFYMKRVGGLNRQLAAGVAIRSLDGKSPQEQIVAIRASVMEMLSVQADCYQQEIRPALRNAGIHILTWHELNDAQRKEAADYFHHNVVPVATPLAFDPGHPFPFISNLSLSLGVTLRHPEQNERLFARVKVPQVLPSLIRLQAGAPSESYVFISLIELMRHNIAALFEGMQILSVMSFRITRNADVERDEEDAEDLLELIEQELRARRFAKVVRLEHTRHPDPWMLELLVEELDLTPEDVYEMPGPLDYTNLLPIADLPIPSLKYETWTPRIPLALLDEDADFFTIVRRNDLLVHHPYESFSASVERFIRTAADDPRVLAIKMTLYRTGDESPFINTLVRAAESGKQVVCVVELKARFDEQRNIQCAQKLENAGVHVVYGIVGLKTHTKTALVVRREADGLRCYAHIGTGNYHAGTATLYTDLGLFTARPEYTRDIVELFHYLTGRSLKRDYAKLLVAPVNMRRKFMDMIAAEIEHHQAGRPAHIVAKMNSLEDRAIMDELYRASQAGVPIDLIVRGFCCMRPQVRGLSEKIRVTSIIGRFLEHSRIYYFRNGASEPAAGGFFIGSADWMYRNLENRVEAVTPVEERTACERLWHILQVSLNDQRTAWDMMPDGTYIQRVPSTSDGSETPQQELGAHNVLMQHAIALHSAAPIVEAPRL